MSTEQINRDQWEDFLSAFSAHNQTRNIVVDVQSSELGQQRLVDNEPLIGIEPDFEDEYQQSIIVVAGDPEGADPAALTHQVLNPKAIWVKEDNEGRMQALDIETDDGKTIIQLM